MIDYAAFSDTDMYQWVIQQFPTVFNQGNDSNNRKWLDLVAAVYISGMQDINHLYEILDVSKAEGAELDLIAADWGVSRVDNDDDFLRFQMALAKLRRVLGTDENSIITLIATTLGVKPSDFTVETRLSVMQEVEAIKLINIPDDYAGDTRRKQLLFDSLQDALADEVRLTEISYVESATAELYVGAVAMPFNYVEVGSDVDTETIERQIDTTAYLRSTQTVNTTYEIESEEVTHG